MITNEDMGKVFASMRIAYGGQWKHGESAVRAWRNALSNADHDELMSAVNRTLSDPRFEKHPPTLPQFIQVVNGNKERPTTFLPKPKYSPQQRVMNLLLFKILGRTKGVDSRLLSELVEFKNALVSDLGDKTPTQEFVDSARAEIEALIESNLNHELLAQESAYAKDRFAKRMGAK